MAMRKAKKNTGASDKAIKAQSARLTQDAAARKKSGQSYVDKRGKGPTGVFYNDLAGTRTRTNTSAESMKKMPTRSGTGIYTSRRTGEIVRVGPYGRTAQRGVDQAKRAGEKKAKKAGKK
jgi:hypothetical protein